jgi:hypothetical protein
MKRSLHSEQKQLRVLERLYTNLYNLQQQVCDCLQVVPKNAQAGTNAEEELPPAVALLFLTRGPLPHEPTWRLFFDAARAASAGAFCSCCCRVERGGVRGASLMYEHGLASSLRLNSVWLQM